MDSKNKFWRGVMVGVLVTALVCLITVGASAGIYMFGRRVIDNQTQVQVQTEGTPSQAQEPSILRMSRKSWSRFRILSIKSTCLRKKLIHPRRKPAFIRAF